MDNITEKNKKTTNGLVYLLLAFTILAVFFGFKKNSDYNKLENVFREEKTALKSELDELIEDYKGVKVENKALSDRLEKEMDKIVSLRDSIKELAGDNYSILLKFRKRVATLERENHDLFAEIDSLKLVNKDLKHQNVVVVEQLKEKSELAEELQSNNEELQNSKQQLEAKVKVASIIEASAINAVAMKERSSGKMTTTSRSSRTDAFRINFKLLENNVRTPGKVKVYVQIAKDNKVIGAKGKTALASGNEITYSDELIADYANKQVDILSLVLVNRDDIDKGEYRINIFVDGLPKGTKTLQLR